MGTLNIWSRALVLFGPSQTKQSVLGCLSARGVDDAAWIASESQRLGFPQPDLVRSYPKGTNSVWVGTVGQSPGYWSRSGLLFNSAAYAPAMRLSHLSSPDLSKTFQNADFNSLAFQSTIQNEALQT